MIYWILKPFLSPMMIRAMNNPFIWASWVAQFIEYVPHTSNIEEDVEEHIHSYYRD